MLCRGDNCITKLKNFISGQEAHSLTAISDKQNFLCAHNIYTEHISEDMSPQTRLDALKVRCRNCKLSMKCKRKIKYMLDWLCLFKKLIKQLINMPWYMRSHHLKIFRQIEYTSALSELDYILFNIFLTRYLFTVYDGFISDVQCKHELRNLVLPCVNTLQCATQWVWCSF